MHERLTVADPVEVAIGNVLDAVSSPAWLPWPLPTSWVLSGLAYADAGPSVTAFTGPDTGGDPAELLLVTEEPGGAVGGRFAGSPTHYPSGPVGHGAPHATFSIDGRTVPLWAVPAGVDRSAFAGEAAGRWLWVIWHPAEASVMMVEQLSLVDLRHLGAERAVLPIGELSPRLLLG